MGYCQPTGGAGWIKGCFSTQQRMVPVRRRLRIKHVLAGAYLQTPWRLHGEIERTPQCVWRVQCSGLIYMCLYTKSQKACTEQCGI